MVLKQGRIKFVWKVPGFRKFSINYKNNYWVGRIREQG